MIGGRRALRLSVPPRPEAGVSALVPLAASMVLEAAAAAVLVGGWVDAFADTVLVALSLHVAAGLFVLATGRVAWSRKWLGFAAALAVPVAGTWVAIAAAAIPGRGLLPRRRPRRPRPRPDLALAEARRARNALPLWDALAGGDDEQRRVALRTLARRDDPEAIAVLRRVAAARDPDLAVAAALALDQISERAERSATTGSARIVRDATG